MLKEKTPLLNKKGLFILRRRCMSSKSGTGRRESLTISGI